jgi:hypothetical protein
MRLINVDTLKLEEFFGTNMPKYAILSHCWAAEEVSFQDWQNLEIASCKAGFHKIISTCTLAKKDGLEYAWVDTNCIDKTSSAELSEAINSMFSWYKNATVCYAYLQDVVGTGDAVDAEDNITKLEFLNRQFKQSRWFTRGWTLQELLAPANLVFYTGTWEIIGTKTRLAAQISRNTEIGEEYLVPGRGSIFSASVAKRMSWLSKRSTTREEDLAYCMLGIFEISMPMLYGEGSKAFHRLQEEIMRVSSDQTLFTWTWPASESSKYWRPAYQDSNGQRVEGAWITREAHLQVGRWEDALGRSTQTNILANSPQNFSAASHLVPEWRSPNPVDQTYALTNFGLSIRLELLTTTSSASHGYYIALLSCRSERDPRGEGKTAIGIPVWKTRDIIKRASFPAWPIRIEMPYQEQRMAHLHAARNAYGDLLTQVPLNMGIPEKSGHYFIIILTILAKNYSYDTAKVGFSGSSDTTHLGDYSTVVMPWNFALSSAALSFVSNRDLKKMALFLAIRHRAGKIVHYCTVKEFTTGGDITPFDLDIILKEETDRCKTNLDGNNSWMGTNVDVRMGRSADVEDRRRVVPVYVHWNVQATDNDDTNFLLQSID